MTEQQKGRLTVRPRRETLVDEDEDGPLELGVYDFALPCRRFVVEHKVAEVGKISVTAEFLLRLVRALGSCTEETLQTFFGYDRREMAYVLGEVEEADYVSRADGRLALTEIGQGLFRPGSEDPLIFEVERKSARVGFDLLSLAPADNRSTSWFERNLPELPLGDPAQVSDATGRVPARFRRFFREFAPRMDPVSAARRSLYSIDAVRAEDRFSNVVRVRLLSTGLKPMQAEVDLSAWRSDHEVHEREAVGRSVLGMLDRLTVARRDDEADAYRLLVELAPDYLKEWTRRDGLSVQRYYRNAFTSEGDVRADRKTTPIVGSLFGTDNARRLVEVASNGLKRTARPAHTLFWVVPQVPLWGSTSIMAEAVEQLRERVIRNNDDLNARVSVQSLALTAGRPEAWIKEGFGHWRESDGLVFPAGFELLLVPGAFVAALVHAPIGSPSGIPVPLGFASFDRLTVDRAMALLRAVAPRYGLTESILQDLAPDDDVEPRPSGAG